MLEIQLRRPTTVDPHDTRSGSSAATAAATATTSTAPFSLLLGRARLRRRVAPGRGRQPRRARAPGPDRANHLALTVHGLPSPTCPSGDWLVDAGLGDALHEPLPLHEGTYVQGPLTFRMAPSQVEPGGWRLDHDPRGSFAGMDFRAAPATTADFLARHDHLSNSPESSFVRTCSVQRRDARGVDALTGCVLRRDGFDPVAPLTLETADEWFGALREVFDLPLDDVDATERAALWTRVHGAHESWLAANAS